MKKYFTISIFLLIIISCGTKPPKESNDFTTLCNPVNISYRFAMEPPSRREAADPSVIWYRDRFFLFASKSGGYWHSKDLNDWIFLQTDQIPVEEYAPTALVIGDTLYFLGSSTELSTLYKSTDPLSGTWSIAVPQLDMPVWDPAFFMDDDNRLYLYWGCSDVRPLFGVEVDYNNNFAFMGEPVVLMSANTAEYGWEVPGDYNTLINQAPWIEGAWVTKKDGTFYLQYSGPGTEFKSYADAVYVSENPLGPFTLQKHNPMAYKPEGFAAGAGHGGSFEDPYGNFWHMGTITISQKHIFERRLGLYPVFYDQDGQMFAMTKFGDYPMIMPDKKISSFEEIFPGWMLLSYGKEVTVSSSVDTLSPHFINDENIRTYWSAQTGNSNEFAMIDLGNLFDVYAIQVNFAEHNTQIFGRQENMFYRYIIEHSQDGANWELLVDKSDNSFDYSHDYIQLNKMKRTRYLRINNIQVPDGHFALSGFRIFGKGDGPKPSAIGQFKISRKHQNRRSVTLTWDQSSNTTGYNISFGTDKNNLHNNYMVYNDTTITINVLNTRLPYWFAIEAFNETGITPGKDTLMVR